MAFQRPPMMKRLPIMTIVRQRVFGAALLMPRCRDQLGDTYAYRPILPSRGDTFYWLADCQFISQQCRRRRRFSPGADEDCAPT